MTHDDATDELRAAVEDLALSVPALLGENDRLRAALVAKESPDAAMLDRALDRLELEITRNAQGNPNHKGSGPGGGQFTSGGGTGGGGQHDAKRQRRKERRKKQGREIHGRHKREWQDLKKEHKGERKSLIKEQGKGHADLRKEHANARKEHVKWEGDERKAMAKDHAKEDRELARDHARETKGHDRAREKDHAKISEAHKKETGDAIGRHQRHSEKLVKLKEKGKGRPDLEDRLTKDTGKRLDRAERRKGRRTKQANEHHDAVKKEAEERHQGEREDQEHNHAWDRAAKRDEMKEARKGVKEEHAEERKDLKDRHQEERGDLRHQQREERKDFLAASRQEFHEAGFKSKSGRDLSDEEAHHAKNKARWEKARSVDLGHPEGEVLRKATGNPHHKGKGEGGGQFSSTDGGGGGSAESHGKHGTKRQKRKPRQPRKVRKPGQKSAGADENQGAKPPRSRKDSGNRSDTQVMTAKAKADRLKKGKPAEYASEKARRAAEHQNKTDGEIQTYTKNNEHEFAKRVGGKSFPDNDPVDIQVEIKGKTHGIELKTITHGTNDKVTMKKDAIARKVAWEKEHKTQMNTVVVDHRDRFAGGKNKALHSGAEIYFRRGVGSFRIGQMMKVRDEAHLKELLATPYDKLPKAAQGPIRGTKT